MWMQPFYPVKYANQNRAVFRAAILFIVAVAAFLDWRLQKSKESGSPSVSPSRSMEKGWGKKAVISKRSEDKNNNKNNNHPPAIEGANGKVAHIPGDEEGTMKAKNGIHHRSIPSDLDDENGDRIATTSASSSPKTLVPNPRNTITTHDVLKGIAICTMFLDHFGRSLIPGSIWWRVLSRAFSMPVFFFLNGQGTVRAHQGVAVEETPSGNDVGAGKRKTLQSFMKRNSTLKLIAAYVLVHYVCQLSRMSEGTIILWHAIVHLALSHVNLALIPGGTPSHALIASLMLIVHPLFGDGLLLDAGVAPLSFAVAGQLSGTQQQAKSRFPFLIHLAVASLIHASNSCRVEYDTLAARTGSWSGVWLPAFIAMFLFLPLMIILIRYRRRLVAIPSEFSSSMKDKILRKVYLFFRFCSRYALEIYVVHTVIIDQLASGIYGKPVPFYL